MGTKTKGSVLRYSNLEADGDAAKRNETPLPKSAISHFNLHTTQRRTYEAIILTANGGRVAVAVDPADDGDGVASQTAAPHT